MKLVQRSDFLRLLTAAVGGSAVSHVARGLHASANQVDGSQNILIIVLDATSATNMSLYGYPRRTTPNLERLAEGAVVFHNHYANGNYTTSGTASLLSGMLPWTHRAMPASAVMREAFAERNAFTLLKPNYLTAAGTQNNFANLLLYQMGNGLDDHLPMSTFGLLKDPVRDRFFRRDGAAAYRAYQGLLGEQPPNAPNALVLSFLLGAVSVRQRDRLRARLSDPGLAEEGEFATWTAQGSLTELQNQVRRLSAMGPPFLGYFHFLFPHVPYRPGRGFVNLFKDDQLTWRHKRAHTLSQGSAEPGIAGDRRRYDEYLANIDAEFGRIMEELGASGLLDNTIVFLTSDHGEMFERGEIGHITPLLYEPVVRIPLLIWPPGRWSRQDIFARTSNVDILPTLLQIAGLEIPDWCEGRPLPGLGGVEDPSRGLFIVEAKTSPANRPLERATVALVKENYKLICYKGYVGRYDDYYELYERGDDHEELKNLLDRGGAPKVFWRMQDELLTRWAEADRPFGDA